MRFLKNYFRFMPWIASIFVGIMITAAILASPSADIPVLLVIILIVSSMAIAFLMSWVASKYLFRYLIPSLVIPSQVKPETLLPESQSIQFKLEPTDIQKSYKCWMRQLRNIYIFSSVVALGVSVVSIINQAYVWSAIFFVNAIAGLIIMVYYGSDIQINRLMKQPKWKEQLGQHQLTINEQGILDSGEFGSRHRGWNDVALRGPIDDYLIIGVRKPLNRAVPWFIPKRAFQGPDAFASFFDTAKTFQNIALSK
jgi:hypothetical protein